eukprot:GDKI01048296.1.p2 GENE.GDKI01048296.1~~GDKI01048296.1.p2  ORF type:complete len:108 (+),score=16.97 GDKI01048296.1:154-477(+)
MPRKCDMHTHARTLTCTYTDMQAARQKGVVGAKNASDRLHARKPALKTGGNTSKSIKPIRSQRGRYSCTHTYHVWHTFASALKPRMLMHSSVRMGTIRHYAKKRARA